ncbi:MAG: hypothetical protein JST29_12855 [Bacteroidetes bacterium]|nr:hypothetical protein [Bacteroidota bacterium]MBS1590905.1 hypothetical protein [Bacteroidota bacterium]
MNQTITYQPNKAIAFLAKTISYIFHPLFIPTYVILFLVWQFPFEFANITSWQLKLKLFGTFWMTAFFPAFAVFLLKKLNFINSIFLRTQKDRIIPYVITMFFYWWMYYLSRSMKDQPEVLRFFYFGIFMSTVAGLIINNFIKISLHALAMGGAITALILFALFYQTPLGLYISVTILIAAIVCTSRLALNTHNNFEIYAGLIVGAICQLIGYWFAL